MALKNKKLIKQHCYKAPAGKVTRGYILDEYTNGEGEKAYILPGDTEGVKQLYSQGYTYTRQIHGIGVMSAEEFFKSCEIYTYEETGAAPIIYEEEE